MKLLDDANLDALFGPAPIFTKIRDDNPTRYIAGAKVVNSEEYIQTCITNYVTIDPNANIQAIVTDIDDPYSYEVSTVGGGNGRWGSFDPNSIDPAEIPALPTISVARIGIFIESASIILKGHPS